MVCSTWGGISNVTAVKLVVAITHPMPIAPDVTLEDSVVIFQRDLVNLYGCSVGAQTKIGVFVQIQKGAVVCQRCKISSHTFICEGVTIEDEVFVGHGVVFINDPCPRATIDGRLQTDADWTVVPTRVGRGASIGSGATIMCGLTIGAGALIGAGAVVTKDVAPGATVAGVPARLLARTRRGVRQVIGVGVIGYGYWGPNLVRNFTDCADAVVRMVCDIRQERLAHAARRYRALE
jgi:acetyltransferase-like isoleucine patch superfamily enzyme